MHRDTHASCVGHTAMLNYFALASGQPTERVRARLLQKMVAPLGPPPPRDDDESDSD